MTDSERLFGSSLYHWIKDKGYKAEADYIETVNN